MPKFPSSTKSVSANRATLPRVTKKAGPAGTRSAVGTRDALAAAHRTRPHRGAGSPGASGGGRGGRLTPPGQGNRALPQQP